ncbi:hypothetical protein Tco_1040844 [Tanacetum coccineum]|uniref:Uncharacterized protein n=1 Tax=Tanacetum coccineum TaxID=301880 RepID=A0ABQ5GG92_9ASTR
MNMGQDRQIQTVGGNGGNQFGYQTKEKGCCVSSDSFVDCSKKEAGIQLQAKEFDLMAAAGDLDEIEEVISNCILMANLQQASTSGTQSDKAPIYDSDGSAECSDFIQVSRAQTKSLTDSLNTKHHDTIYENAKLRSQLFDKTPEQKYTTKGTSVNAKFENQSIEGKPVLYHSRNHSIVRQSNAFQSE